MRVLPPIAILLLGISAASGTSCLAQVQTQSPDPIPDSPAPQLRDDLVPYAAMGSAVADSIQLSSARWSGEQFEAFLTGIRASHNGRGYPLDERAQRMFEEINERQREAQTSPYSPNSQQSRVRDYMAHARAGLRMRQTESGLLFRVMVKGEGPRPRPNDTVVINISAKGPDGVSELPQLAATQLHVRVGSLFPGLAEGLQLMALGAKAKFIMPPELTFGDGKWPDGVDRGTPIWINVELVDILPP